MPAQVKLNLSPEDKYQESQDFLTRNFFLLFAASTILAIAGCQSSPVDVSTDYDHTTEFAKLLTYRWYDEPVVEDSKPYRHANDIIDKRLRQKIDEDLAAKGIRKVENGADFFINYGVTKEKQTDIRSYHTYGGYAPGLIITADSVTVGTAGTECRHGLRCLGTHRNPRQYL